MRNKWKGAFLVLLGIDILIVVILLSVILSPAPGSDISQTKAPAGDSVAFKVKTNKNDLNRLINYYLKKEAADSPIDYRVILGNEVELYGTLPVFSQQVNLKLTFEPESLSNGDLELRQKSISIGSLHLPVSSVLNFINETYKLPNGIDIRPNEKKVYVHLQQLKLKSNIKIKSDKFDLKQDDIAFTLLVPVK